MAEVSQPSFESLGQVRSSLRCSREHVAYSPEVAGLLSMDSAGRRQSSTINHANEFPPSHSITCSASDRCGTRPVELGRLVLPTAGLFETCDRIRRETIGAGAQAQAQWASGPVAIVPEDFCERLGGTTIKAETPLFFTFPEDARWNAERQAVEFGVEIGEDRGVVCRGASSVAPTRAARPRAGP